MTKAELVELLEIEAMYDDGALIVFEDEDTGKIFTAKTVRYEPQSSDDGGNATSTGSTIFICGSAY